jgi:Ca2+-transporting ATPase
MRSDQSVGPRTEMASMGIAWHAMTVEDVFQALKSGRQGLDSEEAKRRLQEYGFNELKEKEQRTALGMFLEGFKDVFIMLLIVATVLSAIIGYYESMTVQKSFLETYADAITIGIIVLLVAIAGFIQNYRAEKALEALRKLTAPKARVFRDGREMIVPAKEVVPGDLLAIESGDTIAADARIVESIELKADEAVLTGESNPVTKSTEPVKPEASVGERKNMLFMGTHTIYGRGKAVVTSTGMNTEFGKIAEIVQTAEEEETPLQKRLDRFAKKIAKVVLVLSLIIFVLEVYAEEALLRGFVGFVSAIIDSFMTAISLAISVVPEGLPAIVLIAIASAITLVIYTAHKNPDKKSFLKTQHHLLRFNKAFKILSSYELGYWLTYLQRQYLQPTHNKISNKQNLSH